MGNSECEQQREVIERFPRMMILEKEKLRTAYQRVVEVMMRVVSFMKKSGEWGSFLFRARSMSIFLSFHLLYFFINFSTTTGILMSRA
jgi:hypothetical protein